MITASELAGYFAAHAVWSLSESDTFTPMFVFTTEHGERRMERLIAPEAKGAVTAGREKLERNEVDANDGALLFDGRITTETGKLDAVIIEMRSYGFPWAKATIAVPYTPHTSDRFRVHRPKLLLWHDCGDFDLHAAFEAFFRGSQEHERGATIWNAHLDQSK
jgi:hypothetical protein